MNRQIISEVNRIREMMGLSLILEQAGAEELIYKVFKNSFEKGGDAELNAALKATEKRAEALGQTALKNRIQNFRTTARGNQGKIKLDRFINDLRNTGFSNDVFASIFEELPAEYISGLILPKAVGEQIVRIMPYETRTQIDSIINSVTSEADASTVITDLAGLFNITEKEALEVVRQANPTLYGTKRAFFEKVKLTSSVGEQSQSIIGKMGDAAQKNREDISLLRGEESYENYMEKIKADVKKITGEEMDDALTLNVMKDLGGDQTILNAIKAKKLNITVHRNLVERFAKGEITVEEFIDESIESASSGGATNWMGLNPNQQAQLKTFLSKPKNRQELKELFYKKISQTNPTDIEQAINEYVRLICEQNQNKCLNGWQITARKTFQAYDAECGAQKAQATSKLGKLLGTGPFCGLISGIFYSWVAYFTISAYLGFREGSFKNLLILFPNYGVLFEALFPSKCLTQEEIDDVLSDPKTKISNYQKELVHNNVDWVAEKDVNFAYAPIDDEDECQNSQIIIIGPIIPPNTNPEQFELKKIDKEFKLVPIREKLTNRANDLVTKYKNSLNKATEKLEKSVEDATGGTIVQTALDQVKQKQAGSTGGLSAETPK
jgi:hypothetical protein